MTPDPVGSVPLTPEERAAVYDVIVECCGAAEDQRGDCLDYLAREPRNAEWRFGGWLGFGGKLYVNSQGVYVDCYAEQKSALAAFAIKVANERIAALSEEPTGPADG